MALLIVSNATNGGAVTDFVLDDFLPYQLAVLSNRLSDGFSVHYRKFGLTIPEWRVVAHLSQEEKVSIREIYLRVEMDKSKVSRAAARLEKAGYVEKKINPADRRLVELNLTPKGRAMIEEIAPLATGYQEEMMSTLPAESRESLVKAIGTLLEKCK